MFLKNKLKKLCSIILRKLWNIIILSRCKILPVYILLAENFLEKFKVAHVLFLDLHIDDTISSMLLLKSTRKIFERQCSGITWFLCSVNTLLPKGVDGSFFAVFLITFIDEEFGSYFLIFFLFLPWMLYILLIILIFLFWVVIFWRNLYWFL